MTVSPVTDLQTRFGIPGEVNFLEGPYGMALVEVTNHRATARIALQGAQLLSWAPHAREPVIWLSPAARFGQGESVRGGVPICWPWFGPHESDPALPAHGFARTAPWEVIEVETLENGAHRLGFRLIRTEASFLQWPHCSPLEIRYSVGTVLEIELRTRNETAAPFLLGEALHTYFSVSDVRTIRIEGLDGAEYLDKTNGSRRKRQTGPVVFQGETDRIYLGTTADCVIGDPGRSRRIRIEKQGSRSTVIWNPWGEKARNLGDFAERGHFGMVCVESGNAADDRVMLAPGVEHRLWVRYSVETAT